MEGATDPSSLEGRLYYKIGLFVHDYARAVLVFSLLLCAGLGYMITLDQGTSKDMVRGILSQLTGGQRQEKASRTLMKPLLSPFTYYSTTQVTPMTTPR